MINHLYFVSLLVILGCASQSSKKGVERTPVSEIAEDQNSNTDSQQDPGKIRGRIVDAEGNGLPGVTVFNKNKSNGTITDIDGYFTIEAKPGQELSISFTGYNSIELEAKSWENVVLLSLEEGIIQQYHCCTSHIPEGNQHCERKRKDVAKDHPKDEVIKVVYKNN